VAERVGMDGFVDRKSQGRCSWESAGWPPEQANEFSAPRPHLSMLKLRAVLNGRDDLLNCVRDGFGVI